MLLILVSISLLNSLISYIINLNNEKKTTITILVKFEAGLIYFYLGAPKSWPVAASKVRLREATPNLFPGSLLRSKIMNNCEANLVERNNGTIREYKKYIKNIM